MEFELDDWQKEVLETEGNIALCSGRQVGKSTVIAMKAGKYAVEHPKKTVLVIASVERQALLLFEKVLSYIHQNHRKSIKKGKDKPTKHKIMLTNGSVVHCLPTGMSGYGIRGYTIDQLYADEAHFIPEDVWTAVTPMLATTGGDIILLSTPFGREGYFFRCFKDESFKSFHISTEEVAKKRPPLMRKRMEEFLEAERERMTKRQYAQEYLGQFVDELNQFFPDELIKKQMLLSRRTEMLTGDYYLGVDIARLGEDESTFQILERKGDKLLHVDNIITRKTLTTMSTRLILKLDRQYDFKQIFVDDGGLGAGVFDQLLDDEQTRRKVQPINNLRKALDRDENRKRKLLKEDLYNNLLRLMEQGKIKLLDDPEIYQSIKSVQFEYVGGVGEEKKLKIFGNYTHIVEGLIRAAWCIKDKSLNIWIM